MVKPRRIRLKGFSPFAARDRRVARRVLTESEAALAALGAAVSFITKNGTYARWAQDVADLNEALAIVRAIRDKASKDLTR